MPKNSYIFNLNKVGQKEFYKLIIYQQNLSLLYKFIINRLK